MVKNNKHIQTHTCLLSKLSCWLLSTFIIHGVPISNVTAHSQPNAESHDSVQASTCPPGRRVADGRDPTSSSLWSMMGTTKHTKKHIWLFLTWCSVFSLKVNTHCACCLILLLFKRNIAFCFVWLSVFAFKSTDLSVHLLMDARTTADPSPPKNQAGHFGPFWWRIVHGETNDLRYIQCEATQGPNSQKYVHDHDQRTWKQTYYI